jgi:GNAT superfamily N-acetyltransferase
MQIRELDLKELPEAYEVLSQLRVDLDYKDFEDLVYEMRHKEYKMIGVFEGVELVTYAGVFIQTNLYHKRHLFVDDLVTYDSFRSRGYGDAMIDYLTNYAKVAMCENIVLSSGIQRVEAHKFYKKMGFEKKSFVFVKTL